jgi:hypothetical protein
MRFSSVEAALRDTCTTPKTRRRHSNRPLPGGIGRSLRKFHPFNWYFVSFAIPVGDFYGGRFRGSPSDLAETLSLSRRDRGWADEIHAVIRAHGKGLERLPRMRPEGVLHSRRIAGKQRTRADQEPALVIMTLLFA